jgi:hypothetical protein
MADKEYSLADFKSTWGDNTYIHYRSKNWTGAADAKARFEKMGNAGY